MGLIVTFNLKPRTSGRSFHAIKLVFSSIQRTIRRINILSTSVLFIVTPVNIFVPCTGIHLLENSAPEQCAEYCQLHYYRYPVFFLGSRRERPVHKSHNNQHSHLWRCLSKSYLQFGIMYEKDKDKDQGSTYEHSERVQVLLF